MTDGALHLTVNGRPVDLADVPDPERLLDTLRSRLGLLGTKEGCRTGDCGACTVVIDGHPGLSCLTLAHEVDGSTVLTVEGAAADPHGARVQRAFEDAEAVQCGYCTPGFVMALTGLLQESPGTPSEAALLDGLAGNLCRCTGYASIVRAVRSLSGEAPK